MIGDAAMEQVYLPGKIRDRIQDLMKSRKITQAELATRIGCSESMLNRFISGKTTSWVAKTSSTSPTSEERISASLPCLQIFVLLNGLSGTVTAPFQRQQSQKV